KKEAEAEKRKMKEKVEKAKKGQEELLWKKEEELFARWIFKVHALREKGVFGRGGNRAKYSKNRAKCYLARFWLRPKYEGAKYIWVGIKPIWHGAWDGLTLGCHE
ncbi:hypothetical protein Tco_0238858, partial [Tanacetum coccineum]